MKRFLAYLVEARVDEINRYSNIFKDFNSSKDQDTFRDAIRFGIDNGVNHDEKLFIIKSSLKGEFQHKNDEDKPTVRSWINTFNRNKASLPSEKRTLSAFESLSDLQNHLKPFITKTDSNVSLDSKTREDLSKHFIGSIKTSQGDFHVLHYMNPSKSDHETHMKSLKNVPECTWCTGRENYGYEHMQAYSKGHGFIVLTNQNMVPEYAHGWGDRGIVDRQNAVVHQAFEGEVGKQIGELISKKNSNIGRKYKNNSAMMRQEHVPQEHIEELISGMQQDQKNQIDARFVLPYKHLSKENTERVWNSITNENVKKILMDEYLKNNKNPHWHHVILNDRDPYVRINYARNPSIHPDIEIHRALVNDKDHGVRINYAGSPNIHKDIEIHRALVNDKDPFVRKYYAENPNIHKDIEIHRALVNDKDPYVRLNYARNPSIHPDIEIHRALVNDKGPYVRIYYAESPNIHKDIEIHRALVNDKDHGVRINYAGSPNIHKDIEIHRALVNDKDHGVRKYYARNPSIHPDIEIHRALVNDKDPYVRINYARNPSIHPDIEIHRALVNDKDHGVRIIYARNPSRKIK